MPNLASCRLVLAAWPLLLSVSSCKETAQRPTVDHPAASVSTPVVATAPSASTSSAVAAPAASSAAALPTPLPGFSTDPASTVVVWAYRKNPPSTADTHRTYFLHADGTSISNKPGVYIAAGSNLYRWDIRAKTSPGERCSLGTNPFPTRRLESAALVPTTGNKAVEVIQFESDPTGVAELRHSVVATLGPYLFARTDSVTYPCGVHPQYGASFSAYAILPNGEVTGDGLEMEDLTEGASTSFAQAVVALNKNVPDDTSPESLDAPLAEKDIEVTMGIPSYRRTGLGWTVQLTGPATWAGGFGGWYGYSRSVQVPLAKVPTKFRGFSSLPQAAIRFLTEHPDEEVGGVSVGVVTLPP